MNEQPQTFLEQFTALVQGNPDYCMTQWDGTIECLQPGNRNLPLLSAQMRAHQIDISVGQLAVNKFKLAEFILKMSKMRPENRTETLKERCLL